MEKRNLLIYFFWCPRYKHLMYGPHMTSQSRYSVVGLFTIFTWNQLAACLCVNFSYMTIQVSLFTEKLSTFGTLNIPDSFMNPVTNAMIQIDLISHTK